MKESVIVVLRVGEWAGKKDIVTLLMNEGREV